MMTAALPVAKADQRMAQQEQFLDVIDRDEAERRFRAALRLAPLGEESVPLAAALGRVLSSDVAAPVDVPSFDRSNVDGYAVRAADTFGADEERPRRLALLSESISTAVAPQHTVGDGEAMAIATGGMLPRGADSVVMVEHTDVKDSVLLVRRPLTPGAGVSFAGSDIACGEIVLRRGETLTSRETGVLAAIGEAQVDVWRRPRVGVLSTGNEIIEPGRPMRPGFVYDSNARIIADAVVELGGDPVMLGIVRDDLAELRQRLAAALAACDVVLLSGGTSKGEGDLSYRVVSELADPGIVAHGVALKPGKPICLAVSGEKPVVILPGFPTSAIFTFHEFVAPVIARLAGKSQPDWGCAAAAMGVRVNSEIGRTEYLLVGLAPRGDAGSGLAAGEGLVAYPMGKGSGSVTTFSRADGFVTIGRHEEIVAAGAPVSVKLLAPNLQIADLVVIGSHCAGLDYLLSELHERGMHCKFLAVGSTAGLQAARQGECDVAGIHLLDPQSNMYNRPFITPDLELIEGYGRMQGVLFRHGDARFTGRSAQEAVRSVRDDRECVMVNRNRGSGTRILIDRLLEGAEPAGYAVQPRSHHAVAAAVSQRRADWGVAIQTVADRAGLGFLPLVEERFDLATPKTRSGRPAVRLLKELLASPPIRQRLRDLGFLLPPP